ncbi:hypothetical protein W911_01050 [Hyphomicrobium nitrativorans NL23]|uniref:Uncharacterized protein n=1 Tax=Hyphomicrobium nitrativorans NL23 TaxID=1029756 RepID=V5SH55_9HYPH|nr:hypothetical protein [Hyphomicrobium nitrativorans]AHB49812.1 hypothetical protein W911_01050 [Hyphomicrobium nitrativorans NL23]
MSLAGVERLLTLLQLYTPLIGSDAATPVDVTLEVRGPFVAGEAAGPLLVLLLLLDRKLAVHLAIGLSRRVAGSSTRRENGSGTASHEKTP